MSDKREIKKNTSKVKKKAILSIKKILKRKKKNKLINKFITAITNRLEGAVKKAKKKIKPKIKNRKNSFFPNLPVASPIDFNYNRKLWLK